MEPYPSHIVFSIPLGGRLKVSEMALKSMLKYAQRHHSSYESGGVLMGRLLKDCQDVIIDTVTEPMSQDIRSRFSFHRSKKQHQQHIDKNWKESNGTITYLGEWHTHPEPIPTPSFIDVKDWNRRMIEDTYNGVLFFIIVGTLEVKAWYCGSQTSKLYSLELLNN